MLEEAPETALVITIDREPDAIVVRLSGRLVAGGTDPLYRDIRPLIAGHKRIILDLTDLAKMDSLGLGTLVRLYAAARSAGCELELYNLGPRVREMLSITNLLSFFTVIGEHNIRMP